MWQTSIKPDINLGHKSLWVAGTIIKPDINLRRKGVWVAGTIIKSV